MPLTTDEIDDLIYACRTDDLDSLTETIHSLSQSHSISEQEIITSAIDIDSDGLGSRTCLLHYPSANGKLPMVEFLLSKASDKSLVNQQNVSGNTPLHWAALNGHLEIVKKLVGAGADPTLVNEAGRDAVVEAEYSPQKGAEECANWLLKECDALEAGLGAIGEDDDTEVQGENEEAEVTDHKIVEAAEANGRKTNVDAGNST